MADLHTSVRRAWSSLGDPGLVVAVSGGPDSVALVCALLRVRPGSAVPLVVAHLNHLLRGGDSDADEAFVRALFDQVSARHPNVHLACDRLDVAAVARQGRDNLEAAARRERYRWLAEVASRHGLRHVVTGHTANDQAETVLHRLLRGAGIEGLRGIAFRREIAPGVEVVRPLLCVTREEVLAYLNGIGQPARHDASNDDPRFTRNRLRHDLLPRLAREWNPRIVEVLGRLASQADEAFRDEEAEARRLLQAAELPRAGESVILDVNRLRPAPRRLVRTALRLVWRREGWSMDRMGFVEYERLADLVNAETGAHDLPGGVRARRVGGVLQLSWRDLSP
jgi:tRNA(Ile)-lysidine synthase